MIEVYTRGMTLLPTHPVLIDEWKTDLNSFIFGGRNLFSVDLTNFHGRTLDVVSFDYAPFTTRRPALDGEKPIFDGIEVLDPHSSQGK